MLLCDYLIQSTIAKNARSIILVPPSAYGVAAATNHNWTEHIMATTTTTSPFVFLKCHTSPPCHTETLFTRTSYKAIKPQSQTDDVREEQVVVVGAGIADLATALSLHRL